MKKKIACAISGGVDSAVAAGLLVKRGYEVVGFHMHLWAEDAKEGEERVKKAKMVAKVLKIPFEVVDSRDEFKKKVVNYFLDEFAEGRTPNPCVRCNQYIKFGRLLEFALNKAKCDYLATGHYARIIKKGHFALLRAVDKQKDQSYFLYTLTQEQLAHLLFPIGEYTKKEVLQMAKKWKLPILSESRAICFFKESDYRPFLRRQIREKIVPGEVGTLDGRVIGRHFGLPLYTIGQRHGFKLKKGVLGPMYVVDKDISKNRLVVGFGSECERRKFWVGDINWIAGKAPYFAKASQGRPPLPLKCQVKIRHQGEMLKCKVQTPAKQDSFGMAKCKVKVILGEPQRGVAAGQSAVFYASTSSAQAEEVIGGGIIVSWPLTFSFF